MKRNISKTIRQLLFVCLFSLGTAAQAQFARFVSIGTQGDGVIFAVNSDGSNPQILKTFTSGSGEGYNPDGELLYHEGRLYGVASNGGPHGRGVIFSLKADGSDYQIVYAFTATTGDGQTPKGGLMLGSDGLFWGTTNEGGTDYRGTMYSMSPDGSNFSTRVHLTARYGQNPYGIPVEYNGRVYATARVGGADNQGSMFVYVKSTGAHGAPTDFNASTFGKEPQGSPLLVDGSLWVQTHIGGYYGYGTIIEYEVGTDSNYLRKDLTSAEGSKADGTMIYDGTNFWGMAEEGGANNLGTIFKYDGGTTGASFSVQHSFDGANGSRPTGRLTKLGTKFYGLTYEGGINNVGIMFSVDEDGSNFTKILDLSTTTGSSPIRTKLTAIETEVTLAQTSVDEDAAIGTSVGAFSVINGPDAATYTYTVSGTTDFGVTAGELVTTALLDYETTNEYTFTVTANDGTNDYSSDITITVNNVNEDPTGIAISNASVSENMPVGTVVGALSGTDPDAGTTLTFSVTSSEFAIDGTNLVTDASLDYETVNSYDLTITAEDGQGGSYDEVITITVEDQTTPQVIYEEESLLLSSGFGTYEILAEDLFFDDEGDAMTFSAASDNESVVTVEILSNPDRLVITEIAGGSANISISAGDGSAVEPTMLSLEIIIADVTSDLIAHYKAADGVDYSGNGNNGTNVGVATAVDRFGNDGQAMSFNGTDSYLSLPSGLMTKDAIGLSLWFKTEDMGALIGYQNASPASTPSSFVPIAYVDGDNAMKATFWQGNVLNMTSADANDGEWHHLVLTGAGEKQQLYIDNVQVGSAGAYVNLTSLTFSQLGTAFMKNWSNTTSSWFYFEGLMDDVRVYERGLGEDEVAALFNEKAPELPELVTEIPDQNFDEDEDAFTLIADLTTYFSSSSELSFDLTDDFDGDVLFLIDGNSLLVESVTENYIGTANVTVEASNADGLITDVFALTVNSVNDAPAFSLSEEIISATMDFSESIVVTVTPGTVPSDESGQTVTYSVSTVAFATVAIDESTGAVTISSLAGQTGSTEVTVTADDGQSENNTYSASFTLTVSENQAPVATVAVGDVTMDEDSNMPINIASFFSDPEGDALTLSASSDETDVILTIQDGVLDISLEADYNGSATVTLTAEDTKGASVSIDFTLNVTPVNDAPVADFPSVTASATEGEAFDRELILADIFSDVDGDALSYSVDLGTASTWLSSETTATAIHFVGTPTDADGNITSIITVTATDGTESVAISFQIAVEAVNEAPTALALSSTSVDEDVAEGSAIAVITTTDSDAGDTFNYSISVALSIDETVLADIPFAISGDEIVTTDELDFESQSSFDVTVTVTDAAGATYSQDFTITVNDVAEAPTAISLSNSSITENNAVEDLIGDLSVEDPDQGETYTYNLVGEAPFIVFEGQLLANAAYNFEEQASYALTINVNDGRGNDFSQSFTISILDENDAPFGLSLSASVVVDGAEAGTVIGIVTAEDEDIEDALTYEADGVLFTIVGNELQLAQTMDMSLLENNDFVSVNITATDLSGASVTERFDISIDENILSAGEESLAEVTIYPNPTTTQLMIKGRNFSQYQIMSLEGQILETGVLIDGGSSIPVSGLQSGIYMIQLQGENLRSFTTRFIKQ